jgi:hypothetical protein
MNDPMTMLKADHREVKAMLKKLADTDEGTERESLCEQVAAALSLHMTVEEELVYPLVKDLVGDEEDEEANVEHGLAKEGMAKMQAMVAAPGFGAVVEMLAAGISHHVEEEESELLPELKAQLPRADWLALGDRIADAKAAAGAPKPTPSRRRSAKRAKTGANSARS